MSNTNSTKSPDRNKIFIGIFTLIVVVIAIIIIAVNNRSDDSSNNSDSDSSATTVASVSVVSENGNQDAVIETSFGIRGVEFGKKIKSIKKYESNQADTLNDPYVSESDDGYTYLTYKYNTENAPTFFGTTVAADDSTSMLVYVFYNKKLIEVRIQYGNIGSDSFNSIVSNINSTYGDSTYSRFFSNGSQEYWWKTDKTTLDVLYQNSSVIAYYRANDY